MFDAMQQPADSAGLKPRARRESVFLSAEIMVFGSADITVHRVRNVSTTGVCVDKATALRKGQTVLITVGNLSAVGATVVWVEGGLAGLKFAQQIDPAAARAKAAIRPR